MWGQRGGGSAVLIHRMWTACMRNVRIGRLSMVEMPMRIGHRTPLQIKESRDSHLTRQHSNIAPGSLKRSNPSCCCEVCTSSATWDVDAETDTTNSEHKPRRHMHVMRRRIHAQGRVRTNGHGDRSNPTTNSNSNKKFATKSASLADDKGDQRKRR